MFGGVVELRGSGQSDGEGANARGNGLTGFRWRWNRVAGVRAYGEGGLQFHNLQTVRQFIQHPALPQVPQQRRRRLIQDWPVHDTAFPDRRCPRRHPNAADLRTRRRRPEPIGRMAIPPTPPIPQTRRSRPIQRTRRIPLTPRIPPIRRSRRIRPPRLQTPTPGQPHRSRQRRDRRSGLGQESLPGVQSQGGVDRLPPLPSGGDNNLLR